MNKIFEKLTNQMAETIDSAIALALHNKNQEVDIIHVIWAMLTNTSSVLNQSLNKMNVDKTAIELEAKSVAGKLSSVSSVTKENIKLSRNLGSSLVISQGLMTSSGDKFIAVVTWILANIKSDVF
jgi:ATP-dependent Clp protease ATP-binding subunit ClpB